MKNKLTTLFLLVGSTTLFAQSPQIKKYYTDVRATFQEQNAYNTVAYVEKRWRLAGNSGFNESIYYVENILKQAGYVNEAAAKPSDALTYRIEKRPMNRQTWEPVDAQVEIVGEAEPLLTFTTNRNMLAINSGTTPPEGIEAEIVYVAKPTKDELDKVELTGKILFAEQNIGMVHRTAMSRGAIGAFGFSLPDYLQPQKHVNSIQFSGIQLGKDFKNTFGVLLSTRAKDRLKAALRKGPVRVRVKTTTKLYPSEELTLVADVIGKSHPQERFVFSAHVQEPGANDNATGEGTLAEMARVTADMVKKGAYKPDRSLTFLWGDEIVSTRRYVTEDSVRAKQIQWGMSLDMVGEDTKKTGGTFLIEKMPDPSAVWTRGDEKHTEWGGKPLPEKAIRPHYFNDFILNRCLDQAQTNGWVVKTNPFEGGSDHTPFLDANLPGLLMWHFTDVFYHTDADRLENVSAWEMKNVGVSALVSAMTLTSTDQKMALFLVKELQETALKRLAVEAKLSQEAVQKGAAKSDESHILEVWGNYYVDALGKMTNLMAGGVSRKVNKAISASQEAVRTKTGQAINNL